MINQNDNHNHITNAFITFLFIWESQNTSSILLVDKYRFLVLQILRHNFLDIEVLQSYCQSSTVCQSFNVYCKQTTKWNFLHHQKDWSRKRMVSFLLLCSFSVDAWLFSICFNVRNSKNSISNLIKERQDNLNSQYIIKTQTKILEFELNGSAKIYLYSKSKKSIF